ncbi:MAG: peptide-N-glycosidase [Bacteroidetes bacterium]|nr:peptide-N-glycosidase [Bacteroidota bacterium]
MKKNIYIISTLLLVCAFLRISAQNKVVENQKNGSVIYKTIVNGKENSEDGKIALLSINNEVKIKSLRKEIVKTKLDIPSETMYIDYQSNKTYQVADFKNSKRMTVETSFNTLPKLELTNEKAIIAGFECKKAQTVIRSNKIEIWYTEKAGFAGTPMISLIIPNALIVKVVRNGNFETVIDKIEYIKKANTSSLFPDSWGVQVDAVTYKAKITENYVTTINVFDREQISFGNEIKNPTGENSNLTYKFSNGTVILKKITLPDPDADYSIFAELVQYSNGDAYDRTGSVFIIPTDRPVSFLKALQNGLSELPVYKDKQGKSYQGVVATDDFSPLVELMRFFTPFGIRHYNNQVTVLGLKWEDSTYYKQDITPVLSKLKCDAWVGVFIGNYDRGGHIVSLKLKYYPNEQTEKDKAPGKTWISPLFNTVNIMEMSGQEYGTMFNQDSLRVNFNIPKGLKNIQLQYISTGHGGWDGGDEFNPKTNQIIIDEKPIYSYIPWRSDCATFRKYNPASGNFWNGISSSDLSRSGWCPGTLTNPVFIPLNTLEPGNHKLKVAIPLGQREGGSFSAWCVSGVLIGEFE